MFWQDHPKTYPLLIIIFGLYTFKFFTLWMYRRRNNIKGKDNFTIGINTIYYIFLAILMVLLIMVLLRVNIKELFTSISILAAAIAIVSKDYISNAINGMILMFNNQLSINDHIQIGNHKGKIVHISLLNVQLLNEEDDIIFIPNSTVLSHDIINFSKGESRKASMEFTISAQSMNSIDALEQFLGQALTADDNIEKETFKLKILHVKYNKARVRAEVNLKIRDRKAERRFKRLLLDAWFGWIKKA